LVRYITMWNSLPDYVINAYVIGIFENRLDHFRVIKRVIMIIGHKPTILHGTGSRSHVIVHSSFLFSY